MRDTSLSDSLDCLLALAVCYRLLSPGCDQGRVHRLAPRIQDDWPPAGTRAVFFCVFRGSGRAVSSKSIGCESLWKLPRAGKLGTGRRAFQVDFHHLFRRAHAIVFGRFFLAELAATIDSALACINLLSELRGFKLAKEKPPVGLFL